MENLAAIVGFAVLIGSCIRIFKFIKHKLWLYLPLFLLGGIAIGVGFIFLFGVDPGWAGEMSAGFAGIVALFYETYLEKKYKKQEKKEKNERSKRKKTNRTNEEHYTNARTR